MLTIKNLSVNIGDKKILKSFSYTFEKGKTYVIMGPNGSGKSTLASAVMGNPVYDISPASKIVFNKKDISQMDPADRSKEGMFMTFQSPLSLSGVTVLQLLRHALSGKKEVLQIHKELMAYAKALHIPEDLLKRSLNDGFSGGERKKMEVIQMAVLDPSFIFFDEIDTGVDVDALRTISHFLKKFKTPDKTYCIITHYNRLLKYLKPDEILVVRDGRLVKVGDSTLAKIIEKDGYAKLTE